MQHIDGILDIVFKIGKYFLLFLVVYFGIILFIGGVNPESIITYFEVSEGLSWEIPVFRNWVGLKNIIFTPILIGCILSGILLAYSLFKENEKKSIMIIVLKMIFLVVFGIIAGFILLYGDKNLNKENSIHLRRFIKFWLLVLLIQTSRWISSILVDLLVVLQGVGIGLGQGQL